MMKYKGITEVTELLHTRIYGIYVKHIYQGKFIYPRKIHIPKAYIDKIKQ